MKGHVVMSYPHLMRRTDLVIFMGLELFAIAWAAAMFSLLESKVVAGALAGSYFVASGLFMLWRTMHWPKRWRSLTIYFLFIHVFVISLPMLAARFLQPDVAFEDVRILGIAGPVFHR